MDSFENDIQFSDNNMRPFILFFRKNAKEGQAIYVRGEGKFATWVQRESHVDIVVDSFLEFSKDTTSVEVKVRRPQFENRPDILLETQSCPHNKSEGWIYTCKSDLLCYANLLTNGLIRVHILNMPTLQAWFRNLDLTKYKPIYTKQSNKTESYPIPWNDIPSALILYKGIINRQGEVLKRGF